MEEHTCEVRLPHINGNVVRKKDIFDTGAVLAATQFCSMVTRSERGLCDLVPWPTVNSRIVGYLSA